MAVKFIQSIRDVDATDWNSLCSSDYPFVRHEFFAALEQSGSIGPKSGWQTHHLLVLRQNQLVGAMPLFIKSHSYGEYVFDWAWADAWHRHGYEYYPKLVCAIPFTPCVGPRLLLREPLTAEQCLPEIFNHIEQLLAQLGGSSWHCLFPSPLLNEALVGLGAAARSGCQFHWFNRGYLNFDDFLNQLNSRKRKNINKERRQVLEQGFEFVVKERTDISATDWDFFSELYQLTYLKRSGHQGYLLPPFFHLLGQSMPDHLVMITAQHHGKPVAASLYLRDSQTLYGRYWGCLEEFNFLHFETCYYQGIDYAIAKGLQRFDGGAQGEHKIQRGFEPIKTGSNHFIVNTQFRQAVNHFLQQEQREIDHYMEDAKQLLPFKINN